MNIIKDYFDLYDSFSNLYYRLADFMHRYVPEARDEHLFTLEMLVRTNIKQFNMCLKTLMGNREFTVDIEIERAQNDEEADNGQGNIAGHSFQYISRVPTKTLRCLKP